MDTAAIAAWCGPVWGAYIRLDHAAVVVHLPPSEGSLANQAAVEPIFGQYPSHRFGVHHRLSVRHIRQQLRAGEDEIWTRGRWLWTRIVGSTLCGELVDSMIFYFVAFYGRMRGSWGHYVHSICAEKRMGNRCGPPSPTA